LDEGDPARPLRSPHAGASHAGDVIDRGAENMLVAWFGVFDFNPTVRRIARGVEQKVGMLVSGNTLERNEQGQ
jgi:hypothetical protein